MEVHFERLKRDKRLIKGWVTRKNTGNQENSDRYTKLFDELEATQRSALFNVFQGVTLYMVPITKANKDFLKRMGLDLETFRSFKAYDEGKEVSQKCQEEAKILEEETHTFAFMSQIKQVFTQKASFLNPEVLRYALPNL